jgi:hypothetical protein
MISTTYQGKGRAFRTSRCPDVPAFASSEAAERGLPPQSGQEVARIRPSLAFRRGPGGQIGQPENIARFTIGE